MKIPVDKNLQCAVPLTELQDYDLIASICFWQSYRRQAPFIQVEIFSEFYLSSLRAQAPQFIVHFKYQDRE
jgi:hypothetical protein